MMIQFKLFLLIGLFFSPFAAIMAFLISYEEYLHHYPNKEKPFRLALGTAITTFIIFMLLSAVGGIVFTWMFHNI